MTVTYTLGGGGGQQPSTTSPPTPPPPPTKLLPSYDVFLSFRGRDIRGNFAEDLYEALNKEVNAFMDTKKKPIGYPLSTLFEAINRSKASVVVFSPGFADSKWCLAELVRIVWRVQRKLHRSMPVFFHVSTHEVGHQSGTYEKAFEKHEVDFPSKVKGWRNAMAAASKYSGWRSSDHDTEASLIKDITRHVVQFTKDSAAAGSGSGPGSSTDAFFAYQEQESTAVAWICRIGGFESANSAKLVYHSILARARSPPSSLHHANRYDASYLFQYCDPAVTEHNPNPELEWTRKLPDNIDVVRTKHATDNKKVLAAVDGMEKLSNLLVFATKTGWFGTGSQVVISTVDRPKNLLEVVHVDMMDGYKHENGNKYLDVACFVKEKTSVEEILKHVEKLITAGSTSSEAGRKVHTCTFEGVGMRDNGKLEIMVTERRRKLPVVAVSKKFDIVSLFASCLGFVPAEEAYDRAPSYN